MVKKYSVQSVGLSARLPREKRAEEWRPREEEVSLAEAVMEVWLSLEGAQRAGAIYELGQVTEMFFKPRPITLLEPLLLSILKTSRHLFASTSVSCFLWVTSGNFSKTSNDFLCVWYKIKQCFIPLCITNP